MTIGTDLWDQFVARRNEIDKRGFTMIVLGYSFGLLADAVKCLDSVSPNAAALLCRATVESAGYLFLTRVKMPDSTAYRLDFPKDLAGRVRRVTFDEVVSGLAAQGAIGADLVGVANRIRDDGNFAAHLAAKQDKEFDRAVQELEASAKPGTPTPTSGSRLSVTRDEAVAGLRGSIDILIALTREVRKQMEKADPAGWR